MKTNRSPFIVGFDGITLDRSLEKHLTELNPSGVIFFKRNITSLAQVSRLIRDIRDLLGNIIVGVDHEGGFVSRFPDECFSPPSARALGKSGDVGKLRFACRLQAELLAEAGFNFNFAPVVDLQTSSDSQVIGTRAFSSDPKEVSQYLRVFWEEHKKLNIGIAAKHFPNHGRTSVDSHIERGVVTAPETDLWKSDLVPYFQVKKINVPAVMTAHLKFSAFDDKYPVTLSKSALNGALRGNLGYDGLIISDCVEMSAISETYTPDEIVNLGLDAGLDLIISSFSLKKSLEFQKALNQAFRNRPALEDSETEQRAKSIERLTQIETFRKEPLKLSGDKARQESLLSLHNRVIEKRKDGVIPKEFKSLFIIDLSNVTTEGINADQKRSPVSGFFERFNGIVAGYRSVQPDQWLEIQQYIKSANHGMSAVMMLSSNGYRNEKLPETMKLAQAANFLIHLALLDGKDLMGNADLEWVCHGYNIWTIKAVVEQLRLRMECDKGHKREI